ncbi:MAG TPA: hypothetical protein VGI66_13965 [Streptosporangiaceae bacterium]
MPQPPSLAGIRLCAGLANQAWSLTNSQYLSGVIGGGWVLQDGHPTTAGSVLTGVGLFSNKLDQYWTSSFVGARQNTVLIHPVDDTALCVTLPPGQARGIALVAAACGANGQNLMGIGVSFTIRGSYGFITTPDGSSCLQASGTGPVQTRLVVLGRCVGNDHDLWSSEPDLQTMDANQYAELYAGSGTSAYSMTVSPTARPGSPVTVVSDGQSAGQVWTDLAPGQAGPFGGNANGTITMRPLSDDHLCLSVPGSHYAAGVQLTVQTCNGGLNQEFERGTVASTGSQELIVAGDGQFCVGEPSAIGPGPVDLEPCNQQAAQAWSQFFDWYRWGGFVHGLISFDSVGAGPFIVLTPTGPTTGTVSVGAPAANGTSQYWNVVNTTRGYELQSLYNPSLCLTASAATAASELGAAQCSGSATQQFVYYRQPPQYQGFELQATAKPGPALCMAAAAGSPGPLELKACTYGEQDELWYGPF